MPEHSLTFPEPPTRRHYPRPPDITVSLTATRREAFPASEVREACLIGGFALAIFWLAAELAIAFGLR